MRLLAIVGSLLLLIYFVGLLTLTFHNLSKGMFGLDTEGDSRLVRLFMRQILILLWPLVLVSAEGRHALRVIWTGKEDI